MPFRQLSPVVHALLSLHSVPSAFFGFEHIPVAGSHVPALWHVSEAMQTLVVPSWHMPFRQLSPVVHALLSLHSVPSAFFGFEHIPVAGSHVPALWHVSEAMHTLVVPSWHMP